MFSNLVRHMRGASGLAERAASGTNRLPALVQRDRSHNQPSEHALMALLDRNPSDPAVHEWIVRQSALPMTVIARLVPLLSPPLLEALVARHPTSEAIRRELPKLRRDRPEWWTQAIFGSSR